MGGICVSYISLHIYICMYMDGHPTRAYLEHFSVVFAVNKPLVLLFIFSFYLYTASQVQYHLALSPFLLQFLNNKCTDCTFKHIFSTQKLRTKHYHKPIRSCFYSEVFGYNLVPCNSHAIPMQDHSYCVRVTLWMISVICWRHWRQLRKCIRVIRQRITIQE